MPIDFHDPNNRWTYTTREADETWSALIRANVDVAKKRIADIGCGGGIYTKALASMGLPMSLALISRKRCCGVQPNIVRISPMSRFGREWLIKRAFPPTRWTSSWKGP